MIVSSTIQNDLIFPVDNFRALKEKVLNWIQQFDTFSFLDNHQYQIEPHTQECLVAAGVKRKVTASSGEALISLQNFINEKKDCWLFGNLGYDLKNELELLASSHNDHIGFPDLFFFEPEVLIRLNETRMVIEANEPEKIFDQIKNTNIITPKLTGGVKISSRIKKEKYISIVNELRQHILRGDCYEINFCQEFFAEHADIDPLQVYLQLSEISPNPFSAFYRINDKWLICASPERYLQKSGSRILSQPIKGTSKRMHENAREDNESKEKLFLSSKDRAENVMVVDLVRNDLSKICKEGMITVDELYSIYSFPQVHQMISTISGELKKNVSFSEIIRATFPMGSMTGAPKKRVMELIENYEQTKRGIFSGAIGYISPSGNFDFNVVIRSILFNATSGYLSYQAGSGITFYSDAEKEWEECMLKAEAINKVFSVSEKGIN